MLEVFRNNWKRLMEEKLYLVVSLVLTICAVVSAIVLTNAVEAKGNIALVVPANVTLSDEMQQFMDNSYFNISVMDTIPPKSELVQNRYDAIVEIQNNGSYKLNSIKSEEQKQKIELALKNPTTFVPNIDKERRIGTNIIGYVMMFLLIQGILYARMFADDKEKHMIKRVVISPVAFRKYLYGHAVFSIVMIFVPTFCVIVVAKIIGISIGFSLLSYAGLIGVLAILSTCFALCLNSFFCVADTANMLGSAIILLTSILGGSFYSFTKEESLFDKLIHLLPQKDFINFVDALEKGRVTMQTEMQFLYVMGLTILFFVIAVVKTRKDYIYR